MDAEEFEEACDVLLIAFFHGKLSKERLLLLLWALEEDVVEEEAEVYGPKLDTRSLTDGVCRNAFRFTKCQLDQLVVSLHIPPEVRATNRTKWTAIDGLCVLLRRLAYPNRLFDLAQFFGRPVSNLSLIFNYMCVWMIETWGRLLTDFAQQPWFTRDVLEACCEAVSARTTIEGPLKVWGFIDGTLKECCRPSEAQRAFYSGHKRIHGIKFQAIVAANGMIAHLFGPFEGSRHDAALLRESDLINYMRNQMPHPVDGGQYQIYGDQAYPLRPELMRPFSGVNVTPPQRNFNSTMSHVRMSSEWGFGRVASLWAFVDFRKNLKLLLQPVGAYYICATLLTNCHACLNGHNEISSYFGCPLPALEDYLS